jgi:hypothetical protein
MTATDVTGVAQSSAKARASLGRGRRPPELSHVTSPVELPILTEYACRMNFRLANSESISGLNE